MKRKKVAKKVEPNKKTDEKKTTESTKDKVFDITSPGKSMPSASSRPLIVTHKPNVDDPMVARKTPETSSEQETSDDSTPSAGEGTEMVMSAPKKNRIEPLHTDIVPDGPSIRLAEGNDEPANSEEPPTEEQDIPEEQEDTKQAEKDELGEENEEISDAAAEVTTKKQAQTEAAKQEAEAEKRQAEVEALINNKQFFVPINAVQKRRSMKLVIALVVIIVLLLGFLVLWDAEVFDLGITPPTDFL